MARKRRTYTREFKVEAVKLVTEKGQSVAEAARSLGIGQSLLRSWKEAMEKDPEQAFPGQGNRTAADDELHRLEAENKRLLAERDILKKLMADNDIRAKTARKSRDTTDSNHDRPVAGNVLGRQFEAGGPNEKWVADITSIPTREGWLYLAAVEDLYSRMVVGWSMADHMESRLVVDALEMAVQRRLPADGLLAHSDRGSQYASDHYQRLLGSHGIECSMSGVGQCWDNAPMESFFATLKKELVHHEDYPTRAQARASIFEYIETFYNPKRRHSSLDYRSPAAFEKAG